MKAQNLGGLALACVLCACSAAAGDVDAAHATDAARSDAATSDAAGSDAATGDAASSDADAIDAEPIDAATPDASMPASACPPGSSGLTPTLAGVVLTRVPSVPIDDGFAPGFGIVEGPVWAAGALLVSHFGTGPTPSSRIYRVDASGAASVAVDDSGTNGLALGPDGRLYGGSHAIGGIVAFDLADLGATPETIVDAYGGARFDSPNDLAIRSDGQIYFTDPSYQAPATPPQSETRVYRVLADHSVEVIDATLDQPNGIALSLDERTLYVGSSGGLFRYPLGADGSIAGARVAIPAITGGVDGLGRDCGGNLYVTGSNRVTVLDSSESVIGTLDANGATNVAFGGADQQTLYVTSLGDPPMLRSAHLDVPGLPY